MSDSLIPSFLMSESLRSLTKMSNVSKLLRSFTKNERPWANRTGRSPKMSEWVNRSFFWANQSFAHFFTKSEWFAQKTDERIPSPAPYVPFPLFSVLFPFVPFPMSFLHFPFAPCPPCERSSRTYITDLFSPAVKYSCTVLYTVK